MVEETSSSLRRKVIGLHPSSRAARAQRFMVVGSN